MYHKLLFHMTIFYQNDINLVNKYGNLDKLETRIDFYSFFIDNYKSKYLIPPIPVDILKINIYLQLSLFRKHILDQIFFIYRLYGSFYFYKWRLKSFDTSICWYFPFVIRLYISEAMSEILGATLAFSFVLNSARLILIFS